MSDHVTLREIVTNLLYPPRCLLCGTLCGWEELLCESCQKQQPQAGEFFWEPEVFGCRGILWCARYEGAFRAGMEQLKFEGVRESLPLFGGMLTEAVRQRQLNTPLRTQALHQEMLIISMPTEQVHTLTTAVKQRQLSLLSVTRQRRLP